MNTKRQSIFSVKDLKPLIGQNGRQFHVFLDNETMSVEYLEYPAGHIDPQHPHAWDELYYIISGRSQFTADNVTRKVNTGDNIFVAAQVEHKFHDIEEDLSVIVFFSKATPLS